MATATKSKTTSKSGVTPEIENFNFDGDSADRVLEQLQTGGQNAIGAVRRFLDSTDESLRPESSDPTFIHDIADSALEMSDRMVEYGGDAVRGIVRSIATR